MIKKILKEISTIILVILAVLATIAFGVLIHNVDETELHEGDPDYVRVFIYYDDSRFNRKSFDIQIVKLSDVLKYNGGWFVCENSDGSKNYYYNCRIVIYKVDE